MATLTFYQFLSLISGIFALLLGIIVLGKNRKLKLNQIFFLFTVACAIWLIGSFLMLSSKNDEEAIFWDRIVYVGVVFLPTIAYHVSLLFCEIKNQKKLLSLGYILSFLFLILTRTNYFVDGLYKYDWGVHTQARIFHHFFLIFFGLYFFLYFLNIYRFYTNTKGIKRRQASYFLFASLIMFISASGFLPAYGIDFPPISYGATLLFVLILTLAITRYHLFGIRIILTEILIGLMAIILGVLPFLMPTKNLKILTSFLFFLFLIFAYYLIKAVHEEEKRREEAQVLAIREKVLRKRAEKLANELERLNMAKDQFTLSIQHHLRTPLTPVMGYLSMILEGDYGEVQNPVLKEKLILMQKSLNVLHKLIENLLDINQLKVGRNILNLEKVKLEDLIEDVVKELMPQAVQKGLKIEFEKKPLPQMMLDKMRMREAIFNILDNSIRYTQKGKVKIDSKVENSNCIIEIQDTGIGMTKEEIENFLKGPLFERGVEAKKIWGPGKGIGLTLALEFVKAHGGEISIFSEGRGRGTKFVIKLPIK